MNSRERFYLALNHREPDRPPVFANLTPHAARKLASFLNAPFEEPLDSLLSTRISHTRLLTGLGNDAVGIAACAPSNAPSKFRSDGRMVNEWGMVFKSAGLYNEFDEFPLSGAFDAIDVLRYPFPDPMAPGRYDDAKEKIKKYKESHFIIADLETSIFETSWYLTGLEKMMIDLLLEPPYLEVLLDKVMEINTETGKELIRLGADMIWAGDDFGTQTGMIMDPETWRRLFKPRMKLMFEEFRKQNSNIKIAWHTCGSILPIIPDLIGMGLDVLNPIQPLATGMDPEFLKNEYGKDLVFFGGIDVQRLLPIGKPEEIKSEVNRISSILGRNGGYIIAPAHNIQDDTPAVNVIAFFESVKELSAKPSEN